MKEAFQEAQELFILTDSSIYIYFWRRRPEFSLKQRKTDISLDKGNVRHCTHIFTKTSLASPVNKLSESFLWVFAVWKASLALLGGNKVIFRNFSLKLYGFLLYIREKTIPGSVHQA